MALTMKTAEAVYDAHPSLSHVEAFIRNHWNGAIVPEIDKSAAAFAIVRQGRWLTMCPWCQAALYAAETDRRFFCPLCGNVAVGGKWVEVIWPKDHEEGDALLAMRPVPINRNWEVWESVDDLREQNLDPEHPVMGIEAA